MPMMIAITITTAEIDIPIINGVFELDFESDPSLEIINDPSLVQLVVNPSLLT